MREKVKKVFCFTTFVHALRERAVFGAAEFDNRTFEGESFFNRSSVSYLKHATVKSNSKRRENCPFHIAYSDFTCTPVIDKDGGFPCNKDEAKQALLIFVALREYHRFYSTPTRWNMATVVSKTYYWLIELIF